MRSSRRSSPCRRPPPLRLPLLKTRVPGSARPIPTRGHGPGRSRSHDAERLVRDPTRTSVPIAEPGGSGRLDDSAGDVTGLTSPGWADLRSAELARANSGFTLTHEANEAFPEQGDGTNTMNIATFVDIDGDGDIDYEIWANLSPEGWGTSYFDEREGTARYAADDSVDVEVVDGDVVLRFPASHLAQAPSFRWSIASEYGPYEAIGTDAMARDYLPDDRSGRPFPD